MRFPNTPALLFAGLLALTAALSARAAANSILYVGTYTGPVSKGIYAWRFDATTGRTESLGLATENPNSSFMALRPDGKFLYSVQELGEYQGRKSGAVSAFAVEAATGKLTRLNDLATDGAYPCYVYVDPQGRNLLVSNYMGGSVAVFPLGEDGRLAPPSSFIQLTGKGVNPARQEAPHAHSINLTPDGRFAIVADLGTDRLMVYHFDSARGQLVPNRIPFARTAPGAGPRHLAFSTDARFVYVLNEMGGSITTYAFDAQAGTLLELGTVPTLPADFTGANKCAEIRVHPNGRFLYASNRGHDSLAVFALDAEGGLKPLQTISTGGRTPRNFVLDPTGAYLFAANQESNTVVVFRIDSQTGMLTPTGAKLEVDGPVCLRFLPVP